MIVPHVEGVTVHFDNGRGIRFSAEECGIQLIQTEQWDAEGKTKTDVEYYVITTTPLER